METATKPGSPARGMTRESVELRKRRLASARRRATLLLAGVTLVFIAVTLCAAVAGIVVASRAARLDVGEALRTE